ncbi:sulfotransferase domain-containing protein [Methylomonas sp. EbB]|uniref:Sulfotransferase domain-containing protein n=2 Tax=Methylomonas fluvii TaxID=1854564 RepID=A0ABR9DG35_9GAMM|nr:sulfotransferase domain-containing protein [Methylomonas fluvii]MBD9362045.1 sulfotransferase domain-containing protein [Methylomonas fluvii]
MKRIVEDLTGLSSMEPEITPGKVNYMDASKLFYPDGGFYAWHLFPTKEVQESLMLHQARPVFIMRNIYDLAVSMYYQFANNIDADVGRGRNVDHYFKSISKNDGFSGIIEGMLKPDFVWKGVGPHFRQMELMLEFAEVYPCFVTSYEDMTKRKPEEVQRLANFLQINLDEKTLEKIVFNSRFDVMKAHAIRQNTSSHFRKGVSGSHVEELTVDHIHKIRNELCSHAPMLPSLLEAANLSHVLEVNSIFKASH